MGMKYNRDKLIARLRAIVVRETSAAEKAYERWAQKFTKWQKEAPAKAVKAIKEFKPGPGYEVISWPSPPTRPPAKVDEALRANRKYRGAERYLRQLEMCDQEEIAITGGLRDIFDIL